MELADVTDSKSVDGDIVWVRVPPPAPTKRESRQRFLFCLFGTHEWDSKDERHRATVRWTVVTASDQAPAGARVEPRCLHHEKSTSSEVLFSMKRTLRCMKNEAWLRPMKRGFAARRGTGASLHASAASASRKPLGFRFTFANGKRFIIVCFAIAREIAAAGE